MVTFVRFSLTKEAGKEEKRRKRCSFKYQILFSAEIQDLWTGPTGGKHYLLLNLLQAVPHRPWLVAPAHRSAPSCPNGHDTSASGEQLNSKVKQLIPEAMESFYDLALACETSMSQVVKDWEHSRLQGQNLPQQLSHQTQCFLFLYVPHRRPWRSTLSCLKSARRVGTSFCYSDCNTP